VLPTPTVSGETRFGLRPVYEWISEEIGASRRGLSAGHARGSRDRRLSSVTRSEQARRLRIERIVKRVKAIPKGYVRTYGDIDPGAPRLVGHVLSNVHDLPWHRVVRADGTLPEGRRQRERLLAEGVSMRGERVDLSEARLPGVSLNL